MQNTFSIMMIGNVSQDAVVMAGIGLGCMTKQILGTMILYGINGSIETFTSQAAGAGRKDLALIYLNQGRLIQLLWFLPMALLLCHTKDILIGIG